MVNEIVKDGMYDDKYAKIIVEAHVHLISLQKIRNILETVDFEDVQIFTEARLPWNVVLAKKYRVVKEH